MTKEKQIYQMADIISKSIRDWVIELPQTPCPVYVATALYDADCRKQSESVMEAEEWTDHCGRRQGKNMATYPSSAFECSECHWGDWDLLTADSAYNFCPNCGAKMKDGE